MQALTQRDRDANRVQQHVPAPRDRQSGDYHQNDGEREPPQWNLLDSAQDFVPTLQAEQVNEQANRHQGSEVGVSNGSIRWTVSLTSISGRVGGGVV